jgi:hypothetical protein
MVYHIYRVPLTNCVVLPAPHAVPRGGATFQDGWPASAGGPAEALPDGGISLLLMWMTRRSTARQVGVTQRITRFPLIIVLLERQTAPQTAPGLQFLRRPPAAAQPH